jgi:hypothetical protein
MWHNLRGVRTNDGQGQVLQRSPIDTLNMVMPVQQEVEHVERSVQALLQKDRHHW